MAEPRGRPEAIVHPAAGQRTFDLQRFSPTPALSNFVAYHWLVRLRLAEPVRQQVIAQPRVHLAAENGRLLVHGVSREPFFRTLSGDGHVLGTTFRPGGFRAMLKTSVSSVSGTVCPALDVLGDDDRPVAEGILDSESGTEMLRHMESYLLGRNPDPDPVAEQVATLVTEVEQRMEITRADQLAAHAGLSLRGLQRLFAEYVGISPKWVIQRSRILDATAAAHDGHPPDWAELARRLGFSDQSHLTRVFTQVVGTPPAAYQRDLRTR